MRDDARLPHSPQSLRESVQGLPERLGCVQASEVPRQALADAAVTAVRDARSVDAPLQARRTPLRGVQDCEQRLPKREVQAKESDQEVMATLFGDDDPGLVRSLRWQGGKSCDKKAGLGLWILKLLPRPAAPIYCEPFAGAASILLNKPQVQSETLNDLNGNLVNFLIVCRDRTEELADRFYSTPKSEWNFERCKALLNVEWDGNPCLERAYAMAIVNQQKRNFVGGDQTDVKSRWSYATHPSRLCNTSQHQCVDIRGIGKRLKDVYIANRDALELLSGFKTWENSDVYCDPPYPTRKSKNLYTHGADLDFQKTRRNPALNGREGSYLRSRRRMGLARLAKGNETPLRTPRATLQSFEQSTYEVRSSLDELLGIPST